VCVRSIQNCVIPALGISWLNASSEASQLEFSGLSVNLQRKRILGPLGLLGWGLSWGLSKLFVIR
jgi:hypothetical protein